MVRFTPKERKPGDHIRADDWNSMQREVRDDLLQLEETARILGHRKGILVARGIASHDVFVTLNWDTEAQVLVQFLFPLDQRTDPKKRFKCYAHETSKSGFRIYALSDDGMAPGMAEWFAIGIK